MLQCGSSKQSHIVVLLFKYFSQLTFDYFEGFCFRIAFSLKVFVFFKVSNSWVLKLGCTITKIVLCKNYLRHHIKSWEPTIELLKNGSIIVSHFTIKMTQIVSTS